MSDKKIQVAFKPSGKDMGSGSMSFNTWDQLFPYLCEAFGVKKNETLVGIEISEIGIKAKFETEVINTGLLNRRKKLIVEIMNEDQKDGLYDKI